MAQWRRRGVGGASAVQRRLVGSLDAVAVSEVATQRRQGVFDSRRRPHTRTAGWRRNGHTHKAAVRSDTHHPGRGVYALRLDGLCCECI